MKIIMIVLACFTLVGCAGRDYNPTEPVSNPNAGVHHRAPHHL